MRLHSLVLLSVAVVLASSCTDSPKSQAALPTTPSTATTVSTSTTVAPDPQPALDLCGAYLDFMAHGFASDAMNRVAASLPVDAPTQVKDAVNFLLTGGHDRAIEPENTTLENWVLEACTTTYLKDVHPAPTTLEAARRLFAAIESADRAAAVPIASAAVLARFDPWGPLASTPDQRQFIAVDDHTFRFILTDNGDHFDCSGSNGVIRVCDIIQS